MKKVEKWLWRYRWGGRNVTGSVYMTEEQVRKQHPEAVRVDTSLKVFEEPETEEEIREAWRRTDTSTVQRR